MQSFLGHKTKEITEISDEVIVNTMVSSATAAANAYLNATLTSTTPELRAMYGTSLSQVISGHSATTELALSKGWENPYNSTIEQLSDTYNKSQEIVHYTE